MAETYDFLPDVRKALGTNKHLDGPLTIHILEVKEYLLDAGVNSNVLNSEKCTGVIVRGVTDLWNLGSGNGHLSPYFKERAAQLALKYPSTASSDETTEELEKLRQLTTALLARIGGG